VEKLSSLDTCEHIWTAGVGFAAKTASSATLDSNRTDLLKLLLTCFSEVIYAPVNGTTGNGTKGLIKECVWV